MDARDPSDTPRGYRLYMQFDPEWIRPQREGQVLVCLAFVVKDAGIEFCNVVADAHCEWEAITTPGCADICSDHPEDGRVHLARRV